MEMLGEGEKDRLSVSTVQRKAYLRSVSWSDRSPTKPHPRPQLGNRPRSLLPPLSISRRNVEEWPPAGSDDLGVWPQPPTPGARRDLVENSESKESVPKREFLFKKDKLAFFDKECSRIVDYIYLGSDAVAKNRDVLRQNGITHVLNCVGFVCPEYFKGDLVYKTLWLQDSPSEDITSILYDVFDYFEDVKEQGGRVLVHCCQGVSRSTSLVIAYLMWREGQSFEDAFQYVKAARGVTNPNMGFACQLLQCQKRVHAVPASPNSVLRMYRMAPHSPYDPLHLVPKILNHPSELGLDSRGSFIIHIPSAIYVWIGKKCDSAMSNNARTAAFQVVRYERAQGPILSIKEGEEPSQFWDALLSGEKLEAKDEQDVEMEIHHGVGEKKVDCYDIDFEIFHKALAGGVVPPFLLSGNGSETCLPAREGGWGRLRRRFVCGIIKEFVTSSKIPSPSTSPCGSPDSFSCFPNGSPKSDSNSKSPSLSPSTSDNSSAFTFSPSSSNWSDLSFHSSQPSPSGIEFGDNACVLCKSTPTSLSDAFAANRGGLRAVDICLPCKGISQSIAERRGSIPPPWMLLPTVVKPPQVPRKLVKSWSFSLTELDDDVTMEDVEISIDEKKENDGVSRLATNVLYRWPLMDEVKVLDSGSVYIVIVKDMSFNTSDSGILFVWVGREVSCDGSSENSRVRWEKIGHGVLDRSGLPTNVSVQVVREGEEPEQLLNYLTQFSFHKA